MSIVSLEIMSPECCNEIISLMLDHAYWLIFSNQGNSSAQPLNELSYLSKAPSTPHCIASEPAGGWFLVCQEGGNCGDANNYG